MSNRLRLPKRLVEAFNRKQVVVFIGRDLATGSDGMPSLASLAGELADLAEAWPECPLCETERQCVRPHNCAIPFERAATLYEAGYGRDALVSFVQERLQQHAEPFPVHHKLIGLPIQTIVTTGYDELLEAACRERNIPFQPIVRDTDLSFYDPDQLQIVHLYGMLSRSEPLTLTQADHAAIFNRNPLIAMLLQSYLATRTFVFLGADFNTPYFQMLYSRVVQELGNMRWPPYTVGPSPRPGALPIEILTAEPVAFLDALHSRVKLRRVALPSLPLPDAPYKFLDYFTAADRGIFFGREKETELLTRYILGHRFTVLYAHSGVGKTSLLCAGVIPRLEAEGFKVAYCRPGTTPLLNVQQALETAAGCDDWATANIELILVLDQAEELFTLADGASRQGLADHLSTWLKDPDLPLRVLVSLRVEYLGDLELLLADVQDVLANRFRLYDLAPSQAEAAITAPAKLFDLEFAPNLVEALLKDLGTGGVIRPAEIQIVCKTLYDARQPGEFTFTKQAYDGLSGAAGILTGYLDKSIAGLGDKERQAAGRTVLKSLVTAERTKVALLPNEVAARVAYAQLDSTSTEAILQSLVDERILRRMDDGRVELTHELLIDRIWEWMDEHDLRRLNVGAMLQRALADYEQMGSLLPVEKLNLIQECRETLILDPLALELILRSAIATGYEVVYWLERARRSDVVISAFILDLRDELQQEYVLLSEKVRRLRTSYVIEPDSAIRFQVEKQVEEAEAQRDTLRQQLTTLHEQLGEPITDGFAGELYGELTELGDLLSEKIRRLREDRIIAVDTVARFQLEKQIEQAEAELDSLEQQLTALKHQVGDQVDVDRTQMAGESPALK